MEKVFGNLSNSKTLKKQNDTGKKNKITAKISEGKTLNESADLTKMIEKIVKKILNEKVDFKVKYENTPYRLQRMTTGSSGFDVPANENVEIHPGEIKIVHTGMYFEVPVGYEIQVRSRSGLGKRGIHLFNGLGTIDSDFRGECVILLRNCSKTSFFIEKGDRVAQLVVHQIAKVNIKEVTELTMSERGANGFGSTGIHSPPAKTK